MKMATVKKHFDSLISAVNPSDERADKAKEAPVPVREHLAEDNGLRTVEPHTLLIGSYARNTAVRDIQDVDILVFLDPDAFDQSDAPRVVVGALHHALEDMPDAADVDISDGRRSVRVTYDDFQLDVVPAVAPFGAKRKLHIPDRAQDRWIPSHPLGYGEWLTAINKQHGQRVKPMVKLIKYWRDYRVEHTSIAKPSSYLLEVEAARLFEAIGSVAEQVGDDELFTALLRGMRSDFSTNGVPWVADPMLGYNIVEDVGWRPSDVEAFVAVLDDSLIHAEAALGEDDQDACIAHWEAVFGPLFREAISLEAREMARRSRAGELATAAGGRLCSGNDPKAVASVRPHWFYGGSRVPYRFRRAKATRGCQFAHMRRHPGFSVTHTNGWCVWQGSLQPTPTSTTYQVEAYWKANKNPRAYVRRPILHPNAPHVYHGPGRPLCLYYPDDESWDDLSLVATHTVPWMAEYLYFYEVWLETGKWFGPEKTHTGSK